VNRLALARAVCEVGRKLAARGLISGGEGNIGVRLDGGRVLVTPKGRAKGELAPDDLIEVDLEGRVLRGAGRPSSELLMHLTVLRARPDVVAVVHAHPPVATGFATAGVSVDCDCIPEMLATVGRVPVVPYGMTGTGELSERLAPYLAGHDALLLANHGAVTMGGTLEQAHHRMESLEQGARILLVARLLGGPARLGPEDVARLEALRETFRGRQP
jgi:L-fuculose-phosphate aldolase